jgi:DNA-directed RNA polymerase specialized sigma24 family protein
MSDTPPRRNKKIRLLTVEAFDGLLTSLDDNREQASVKYEELRQSLIAFFATRGVADPNELADETMNRVAYRLAEGQVIQSENPAYYFLAVARNVWREQMARPYQNVSLTEFPTDLPSPIISPEALLLEFERQSESEQRLDCLAHCLAELPTTDRELLLEYHQGRGQANSRNRQAMAQRSGVTLGSLRNRVSRIRDRLTKCVQQCSNSSDNI